jgi:hypothetical protein
MRDGRLLAESAPDALMTLHNKDTLEDVFLELCRRSPTNVGQYSHRNISELEGESATESDPLIDNTLPETKSSTCQMPDLYLPSAKNIFALFWKNITQIRFVDSPLSNFHEISRRKIGFVLFLFFLPSIEVIIFCLAIGRTPQGLHVAVVNQDLGANVSYSYCNGTSPHFINGSIPNSIASVVLSKFDHRDISFDYSSTLDDGLAKGKLSVGDQPHSSHSSSPPWGGLGRHGDGRVLLF